MKTAPKLHPLENRYFDSIERLIPQEKHLLLAVSGGSDSIALMCLAARTASFAKVKVSVGVVNHNLREDVHSELALVGEEAQKLGLPVHLLEVPKETANEALQRGSIQSWARNIRYELLTDLALSLEASHIATGHTADDQAETVMLHMIRGSGIDGISGISPSRQLHEKQRLIRPLLAFHRADLRAYLRSLNVHWAEDPSNRNDRFLRVRIRNELMPTMNSLQPGASDKLVALAREVQGVLQLIDHAPLLKDISLSSLQLSSGILMNYSDVEHLPQSALCRIIRRAIALAQGDLWRIERSHITTISDAVEKRKNTGALPLPGIISAYVHRGSLYLFPLPLPKKPEENRVLSPGENNDWTVEFPATATRLQVFTANQALAGRLVLRTRRKGDVLWQSRHKLKRVFNSMQIPRFYRDLIPLLALDGEIVDTPLTQKSRHPEIKTSWRWESDSPLADISIRIVKV